MVYYPCPKCNAIFNKMSNYKRHLNKKNDCSLNMKVSNDNISLCTIEQGCTGAVRNYANLSINIKTEPEKNKNINQIKEIGEDEEYEEDEIDNNNLCCQYCLKKYSSKSTLTRHLKENCKIKKEKDYEKEKIFKLLLEKDKQKEHEINELKKQNQLITKQNKKLMDKIDKLINLNDKSSQMQMTNNISSTNINSNNINVNNTQNNIVMINFGNEDLGIINKREFIDRVVKKQISGVKIPEEILKIIHFNPQYPQLSNIYISDINREKFMIYEDGKWVLTHIDKIPQIMDKIVLFSNDAEEELRAKHPDNKRLNERLDIIKKYNNMIDDDYIQELKDDYEDRKGEIQRCENFKKNAYDTIKLTLSNEGKKIKKIK
jgi:hypothetical protein